MQLHRMTGTNATSTPSGGQPLHRRENTEREPNRRPRSAVERLARRAAGNATSRDRCAGRADVAQVLTASVRFAASWLLMSCLALGLLSLHATAQAEVLVSNIGQTARTNRNRLLQHRTAGAKIHDRLKPDRVRPHIHRDRHPQPAGDASGDDDGGVHQQRERTEHKPAHIDQPRHVDHRGEHIHSSRRRKPGRTNVIFRGGHVRRCRCGLQGKQHVFGERGHSRKRMENRKRTALQRGNAANVEHA